MIYYNQISNNTSGRLILKIIKGKAYIKDYKKKIEYKHLKKEIERISNIEELILDSQNLKSLLMNPLSIVFGIEQKKGNLKEIYTAKVNEKIRLYIKPVGEYPYNVVEINELEFLMIDNKHYGDG